MQSFCEKATGIEAEGNTDRVRSTEAGGLLRYGRYPTEACSSVRPVRVLKQRGARRQTQESIAEGRRGGGVGVVRRQETATGGVEG